MKRILYGVVVLGVIATAVTALGQTPKHRAERVAVPVASVSAHATCPLSDPSKCPAGCRRGDKAADVAVAPVSGKAQLTMSAATCPGIDPASCPASCRKSAAGASAERVASR